MVKIISIKLSDDEYKLLEERAKKEGYVLLSEYIRAVLLGEESNNSTPTTTKLSEDILLQISNKVEKKLMDYINPFTSQIEDLKKKIAELTEKIEELEEIKKGQKQQPPQEETKIKRQQETKTKKTAIDILKEQGAVYESELKLKDPDAFFNKLEHEGARIIYTERERIAVDPQFLDEFKKKVQEIHTSDQEEAASKLDPKQAKLFKKLVSDGIIIFDAELKGWKPLI
ncbi:MAG: hypothetical protein RXR59_02345 [Sulfolobus sp.]|jgi:TolA-binding protein|nr:hypothetical protein [Stygiolobus sp.]MDT7875425.1 hypothetical protein [Sulfolobaceae archaeon]